MKLFKLLNASCRCLCFEQELPIILTMFLQSIKMASNINNMERKETEFYTKLLSSFDQVLMYEDPELQNLYLSHIPVGDLQTRAEEIRQEKLNENKEMSSQDCLLLALLKWFKCKLSMLGVGLVVGFRLGLVLGTGV